MGYVFTQYGARGSFGRPLARPRKNAGGETTVTLRGTSATLMWEHLEAITIRAWAIHKSKGAWILTAKHTRVNGYQARQRPLVFTAPRPGGFWRWPLQSLELGAEQLRATLGPPVR